MQLAKPLKFVWNGEVEKLFFPPLLIHNKPYMYAGYLGHGVNGSKLQFTLANHGAGNNHGRMIIFSRTGKSFSFGGRLYPMGTQPIKVGGHYYIGLDVMQAVFNGILRYEPRTKQIQFVPAVLRQAKGSIAPINRIVSESEN